MAQLEILFNAGETSTYLSIPLSIYMHTRMTLILTQTYAVLL